MVCISLSRKEIDKRFYERRKTNGQCVNCGKEMDRDGALCIDCLSKANYEQRTTRRLYQKHRICPRCRKNDLIGDEKNCLECSAKAYANTMSSRDKEHYNEVHREWSKRTHHEMIELGICTRCRKRSADVGYKTCGICRAKIRESKRKNAKPSRSERFEQGLCYFCDNPIKQGYKVCDFHYEQNVKNSRSQKAVDSRRKLIMQEVLR